MRPAPVELNEAERDLVRRVVEKGLTMVSLERLWTTLMACRHVVDQGIDGDFVECGVWRGGNAILAASAFRLYGAPRRVWLYDTFEGMTPPTEHDREAHTNIPARAEFDRNSRDTHNDWCYASIEDVRNNFIEFGCLDEGVHFVKGDVCQTLDATASLPPAISVLRLDTDWYASTRKELEILYPRLSIGGVLIIDDYGHWSGAKQATDEYFAANGPRPFLQYTDYTGRVGVKTFAARPTAQA